MVGGCSGGDNPHSSPCRKRMGGSYFGTSLGDSHFVITSTTKYQNCIYCCVLKVHWGEREAFLRKTPLGITVCCEYCSLHHPDPPNLHQVERFTNNHHSGIHKLPSVEHPLPSSHHTQKHLVRSNSFTPKNLQHPPRLKPPKFTS